MNTTPVSLLKRLCDQGEQVAWERFVLLYTPLLCLWARRLGLSGPDVDDLVQDIFAVLVQKLPEFQYDPDKRFRGWLWTVTVNKHREKIRRQAGPALDPSPAALDDVAVPDSTAAVDDGEYRDYLVQRALELMRAEFQPNTWKAFHGCVAGDRPAADVAAELGMSLDAVYAAKSRVLRRLREELAGLLDF